MNADPFADAQDDAERFMFGVAIGIFVSESPTRNCFTIVRFICCVACEACARSV